MNEISPSELDQTSIVAAWKDIVLSIDDWKAAVAAVTPEDSPSGVVYDLPDFAPGRPESFAIVDLRAIGKAGGVDEPHYHANGEVEVHIPIAGSSKANIGGQERTFTVGDVVVINSEIAHFFVPDEDYVVGVVSLPSFDPENYVPVTPEAPGPNTVKFDRAAYAGYIAVAPSQEL